MNVRSLRSLGSLAKPTLATALLAATATFTLASAGAVAAGDEPASSTQATDTTTTTSRQDESARLGRPPHADVKPFEDAKLSLSQAIASAQRESRGKPIAARFEMWHGKPAYLIRTYSANQVWETRIDANSGDAIGQPSAVAKGELSAQTQKEIDALNNAQTSLTDAVNKAEQEKGGQRRCFLRRRSREGWTPSHRDGRRAER